MAKYLTTVAVFGLFLLANAAPSNKKSLKESLSEVLRDMLEEDIKREKNLARQEEVANNLPDCVADDFAKCQFASIQASLDATEETDIPIFIRCSMLSGLSNCDEEVLTTCNETPELTISDNVAEVHGRVKLLSGNCSCIDAKDVYPECTDQCTALPCLNGGTCVSDENGLFEGCICPKGYRGQFCEQCRYCDMCKNWGECSCPDGKTGPFCNMECSEFDENLVNLYRSCIQIAHDVYFSYPYPCVCVYALVLDECVASSANQCGKGVRETLDALGLAAGYDQAKFNLENMICKVGVEVPFDW